MGMSVLNRLWPSADTINADSYMVASDRMKPKVHVRGKINNDNVTIILDNGSPKSVISLTFVQQHNIPIHEAPITYRLFGISGHSTTTLGEVDVTVTLFNRRRRVLVPVLDDTGTEHGFGLLLGTDLLVEWPPILYDLKNKRAISNHVEVDIFTTAATPTKAEKPETQSQPSFDFPPPDLDENDKQKLLDLLSEYTSIYSVDEFDIGSCPIEIAPIELTTSEPISCKPYRVPEKMKHIVQEFIRKLLAAGIIIKSTTAWVSNILLVKKENGKMRPVVDFRKLNSVTVPDRYPLKRIDSLLQKVSGSHFFSTVDLAQGFFQLNIDSESSKKFGIVVEDNVYQFVKLPMGLKNSPALFSRAMHTIFESLEEYVTIYMDDLIITSSSSNFDEHLKAIRLVFDRLQQYQLKIRPEKTHIAKRSVTFLGHYLDAKGIHPAPKHVEALKARKPPSSKKELQQFLGLTNYFHRFIDGYARIAQPLSSLLKKRNSFEWGPDQQSAFEALVNAITSDPILIAPNYSKPFTVITDASLTAIGGAVLQLGDDNELHPISFCSKILSTSERNYSASEQELFAIVYTLQYHKAILYGTEIRVLTDHKPLISLITKSSSSTRLNRWLIELQEFGLEAIEHVAGTDNVVADYLSRPPATEVQMNAVTAQIESNSKRLQAATMTDPILQQVIQHMSQNWKDIDISIEPDLKPFYQVRNDLNYGPDKLLRKADRIIIPESMRVEILKLLHRSHFGAERMKSTVRTFGWWPRLSSQLDSIAAMCKQCNEIRRKSSPGPLQPWPDADGPWQRLHIDFFGPIWNFTWLVIVDSYSKYPVIIKMKRTTSADTIKALQSVFNLFGYCKTIASDNGPQFTSNEFQNYLQSKQISHVFSPPYHPQSNGLAERFVGTTKQSVKKIIAENPRMSAEDAIQLFLEDYRTTPHKTTQQTPAELLFRTPPSHILSTYVPRQPELPTPPPKQIRQKSQFVKGDLVWKRSFMKNIKWEAGTIISPDGNCIYHVQDEAGSISRLHVDDLRPRKSILLIRPPRAAQSLITSPQQLTTSNFQDFDSYPTEAEPIDSTMSHPSATSSSASRNFIPVTFGYVSFAMVSAEAFLHQNFPSRLELFEKFSVSVSIYQPLTHYPWNFIHLKLNGPLKSIRACTEAMAAIERKIRTTSSIKQIHSISTTLKALQLEHPQLNPQTPQSTSPDLLSALDLTHTSKTLTVPVHMYTFDVEGGTSSPRTTDQKTLVKPFHQYTHPPSPQSFSPPLSTTNYLIFGTLNHRHRVRILVYPTSPTSAITTKYLKSIGFLWAPVPRSFQSFLDHPILLEDTSIQFLEVFNEVIVAQFRTLNSDYLNTVFDVIVGQDVLQQLPPLFLHPNGQRVSCGAESQQAYPIFGPIISQLSATTSTSLKGGEEPQNNSYPRIEQLEQADGLPKLRIILRPQHTYPTTTQAITPHQSVQERDRQADANQT